MTNKKANRWLVTSILLILSGFACFVLILLKIGLFNFSGTDNSAKIVAASLALVGALFGSIVTLIGIFIKNSMDQRTLDLNNQAERRLQLECARNNNQAKEAEKRLKLEAAIQAVQLLSSSSGTDVPITQRAGALFAMTNLGLMDLAISMLNQMVSSDRIDAVTATWVINKALESDVPESQLNAASIMNSWPEKFLDKKGKVEIPSCVCFDWNMNLPILVRRKMILAILQIIVARQLKEWDCDCLNGILVTVCKAWENEENDELFNGVGICLNILLRIRTSCSFVLPDGPMNIDSLIRDVGTADEQKTTDTFLRLRDRIEEWVKKG